MNEILHWAVQSLYLPETSIAQMQELPLWHHKVVRTCPELQQCLCEKLPCQRCQMTTPPPKQPPPSPRTLRYTKESSTLRMLGQSSKADLEESQDPPPRTRSLDFTLEATQVVPEPADAAKGKGHGTRALPKLEPTHARSLQSPLAGLGQSQRVSSLRPLLSMLRRRHPRKPPKSPSWKATGGCLAVKAAMPLKPSPHN